jgi:amino acid transporter
LATSERPIADASRSFLGSIGPAIISGGALIGIMGTLNVVMLAFTRLPFAMSLQGQLPSALSRVHPKFHTPHVSILFSAVAVFALSLAGTFIYAVKITVITRVIVYGSTCAALPVLRWQSKSRKARGSSEASQVFVAPAGIAISILCIVLCLWLLGNSEWREARDVSIAVAAGLLIYAFTRFGRRRFSVREVTKEIP